MRKLKFHYEMQLAFSSDVVRHSFSLRCLPKDTCTQKISSVSCEISPMASFSRATDAYGNNVCLGFIEEKHRFFSFRVSGVAVTNSENIDKSPLRQIFYYPTPQTTLTRGYQEYLEIAARKHDPLQKALAMNDALYERFVYQSKTTTTKTTAQQALDQGKGVCQDYAHIMLALCRRCHIPARYVAGFMIGEGATHAWVEIYANGQWFGLDPTNNRIADDQYIKLSEGRDASDCIVDRGVFFGDVRQTQTVLVRVMEVHF